MFTIRATYIPRDDMYFDKEYYISHHMPLAKKLLKDQVNYVSMHAEFDSCVMMNETELRSPGVFVLTVESKSDVDNFRLNIVSKTNANNLENTFKQPVKNNLI